MTEEEMKAFTGYDKLTKEDLWEGLKFLSENSDQYGYIQSCGDEAIVEALNESKIGEYREIIIEERKKDYFQEIARRCPEQVFPEHLNWILKELIAEGKLVMDRKIELDMSEVFTVRLP